MNRLVNHPAPSRQASPSQYPTADRYASFVGMLPKIDDHARYRFRHLQGDRLDEVVQEVVCNCFVAYAALMEQGRAEAATWSSLAKYAVAQVRSGRKVGSSLNIKDVSSAHCQQRKHVRLESLHHWDPQEEEWREILVEDQTATPADLAACRIDFPAWLGTLTPRYRKLALALCQGEGTSRVAKRFRVSPGRISQLRRELHQSWHEFHGECVSEPKPAFAPAA